MSEDAQQAELSLIRTDVRANLGPSNYDKMTAKDPSCRLHILKADGPLPAQFLPIDAVLTDGGLQGLPKIIAMARMGW